jgi:hypothetical protein
MTISGAPSSDASQLLLMASALRSCRDVYMAIFNEGLTNAQPQSEASKDFAAVPTGPAGPWKPRYVEIARDMAIKLVRQQADLCVAAGVLIDAGERIDPLAAVGRAAFEYGSRAFWVLEPRTDVKTRCARALLMELVSINMVKQYNSLRPGADKAAGKPELNHQWKFMRTTAEQMFVATIKDDVTKWILDDVAYESWTEIGKRWMHEAKANVTGDALYNLLAIQTHPQGFLATQGLILANGELSRELDEDEVLRTGAMLLSTFYISLTLLISYHGHQSQALNAWKKTLQQISHVFNDR